MSEHIYTYPTVVELPDRRIVNPGVDHQPDPAVVNRGDSTGAELRIRPPADAGR